MHLFRLGLVLCLFAACDDTSVSPQPLLFDDALTRILDGSTPADDPDAHTEPVRPDVTVLLDQGAPPAPLPYDFEQQSPWFSCPELPVGTDVVEVTAFDSADQYFNPENLRDITAEVEFPQGDWVQIGMRVDLE